MPPGLLPMYFGGQAYHRVVTWHSPKTKQECLRSLFNDARTGMPPGLPEGAMCVQRFDDSLNSAIHTTYRISLRSSSMREPRDPLLKVLTCFDVLTTQTNDNNNQSL
jgi:hypothetical protein